MENKGRKVILLIMFFLAATIFVFLPAGYTGAVVGLSQIPSDAVGSVLFSMLAMCSYAFYR